MAYYITKSKLKGDIYTYRRLKAKNITVKRYTESEKIAEKAYDILNGYAQDKIAVRDGDKKIFAEYIDTFGFAARKNLLQKLQAESSFDIEQYLTDRQRNFWQRLFKINPKKPENLTAAQMQKRIETYKKLGKNLSRGWFHKESEYTHQLQLEKEAESYAENFMHGNIRLHRNEVPVALKYLEVLGDSYEESAAMQAIKSIKSTPIENFEESKSQNRFSGILATFRKKSKQAPTDTVSPRKRISVHNNHNLRYAAKAAGLTLLLAVATLFGFKSDKGQTNQKVNSAGIKITPKKKAETDTVKILQVAKQKTPLIHEQKIWQNFYNTKNEIIAGSLNLNPHKLASEIVLQADKNIFKMPENTLSEQLVYTHLMYKAYGLGSPIDVILSAKQTISAQQQKDIETAVATAGQNGLGVKEIAQNLAAARGKPLGRHSAYNHASPQQRKMFVSNLKQVRALKR
ncbi:MAG: hypothetical protein IJ770_01570 [Alphaproteobacteria bacterium]|nr:hypothetical protein [Alphaproteobacteria bacterium]